MQYQTRSQWGARPPKSRRSISDTNKIYVHHSVTAGTGGAQEVRQIQTFHMDGRGWADIAYNWLVDDDGVIYEGRGWNVAGGATKGENTTSIAVCYLGNADDQDPTDAAKAGINTVIAQATADMGKQDVRGHRNAPGASTVCPGRHLMQWLVNGRPDGTDEEDMDWRDETAFIMMVEQKYKYTGPNHRDPTPHDVQYWLGRYRAGDDPDWLMRAIVAGLESET